MKFTFEQIVDNYNEHVTGHIPNYDRVIDKSINICKLYKNNANILDFGSANGHVFGCVQELVCPL